MALAIEPSRSRPDGLADLTQAERLLAQVSTAQDAMEIRDFAEAARVFAKKAKLGTSAINHATTVKLRAELRLVDVVRAGREVGKIATQSDGRRPPEGGGLPTLADLGIRQQRLVEASKLHDAFDEDELMEMAEKASRQDKELSRKRLLRIARDREAAAKREEEDEAYFSLPEDIDIRHGDFREVLADVESVSAVITDPPYPGEFLPLWSDLAEFSARSLKPGGILVALTGQVHLLEVMRRLGEHLDYWWCGSLLTPGPGYVSHARAVHSQSKPLLFYVRRGEKPSLRLADTITSTAEEKEAHIWQQNLSAYEEMVRRFSKAGELVADPFVGGGTTAVACLSQGRRFVGAEIDGESYRKAVERISDA